MIRTLPTLDSPALADRCRAALDIPRHVAADLGRSALRACVAGQYDLSPGIVAHWRSPVARAQRAKVSIPPDAELPSCTHPSFPETRVQVTNETTLAAARRLFDAGHRPLALNFANGIHPGGGFLNGAKAQEETLCRSSALFATLHGDPMYAAHAARPLPDSTNWAIYSPDVPVFRTDSGTALAQPWLLSFITCAAPYAPDVGHRSADLLEQRIHRVLAVARAYGHTSLVLGAWGCGAFGNDPRRTALGFHDALAGPFGGAFSDVVLAIADWSPERRYLRPFADVFEAGYTRQDIEAVVGSWF